MVLPLDLLPALPPPPDYPAACLPLLRYLRERGAARTTIPIAVQRDSAVRLAREAGLIRWRSGRWELTERGETVTGG